MSGDRELTRRQILHTAINRARSDSLDVLRSSYCAYAARENWPLEDHPKFCPGVTDPNKCVCECHDETTP